MSAPSDLARIDSLGQLKLEPRDYRYIFHSKPGRDKMKKMKLTVDKTQH